MTDPGNLNGPRNMASDIYLIRHGQSTFNAIHVATGVDPMHLDARLSPLGHQQVAQAREALAAIPFELVVCSPLTRAIETAAGLFAGRDVPFLVTCRHRERLESSCDVGRSPEELAADFPHLSFTDLRSRWWHDGPLNERGLPIEPVETLEERIAHFKEWIVERPEKTIAVVGHGTFFYHLAGRFLANCEVMQWSPVETASRRLSA